MVHQYQINQRVVHNQNPGLTGTIIGCVLSQVIDSDMDPGKPWYFIEWDHEVMGTEHQDSISPVL